MTLDSASLRLLMASMTIAMLFAIIPTDALKQAKSTLVRTPTMLVRTICELRLFIVTSNLNKNVLTRTDYNGKRAFERKTISKAQKRYGFTTIR